MKRLRNISMLPIRRTLRRRRSGMTNGHTIEHIVNKSLAADSQNECRNNLRICGLQFEAVMQPRSKILIFLCGIFIVAYIITTPIGLHEWSGWLLVGFFVSLAILFRGYEILKGYSFTIMIFAAVSASMYYPQFFIAVGGF